MTAIFVDRSLGLRQTGTISITVHLDRLDHPPVVHEFSNIIQEDARVQVVWHRHVEVAGDGEQPHLDAVADLQQLLEMGFNQG